MSSSDIGSAAARLAARCVGIMEALNSMPAGDGRRSEGQLISTNPAYVKEDLAALSRTLVAIDTACHNHGTQFKQHMNQNITFWNNLQHRLDNCAETLISLERVLQDFRRSQDGSRGLFQTRVPPPKQHIANLGEQGRRVSYYMTALQESLRKMNTILRSYDVKVDPTGNPSKQEGGEANEETGPEARLSQEAPPPYSPR